MGVQLILGENEWFQRWDDDYRKEPLFWLAEEYLPGSEYCVGIVSVDNQDITLPIIKIPHAPGLSINDTANKTFLREQILFVDNTIPSDLKHNLINGTQLVHLAFGRPPLSRTEWRLNSVGKPCLIEYDHTPALTETSYLPQMLAHAKFSLKELIPKLFRSIRCKPVPGQD